MHERDSQGSGLESSVWAGRSSEALCFGSEGVLGPWRAGQQDCGQADSPRSLANTAVAAMPSIVEDLGREPHDVPFVLVRSVWHDAVCSVHLELQRLCDVSSDPSFSES